MENDFAAGVSALHRWAIDLFVGVKAGAQTSPVDAAEQTEILVWKCCIVSVIVLSKKGFQKFIWGFHSGIRRVCWLFDFNNIPSVELNEGEAAAEKRLHKSKNCGFKALYEGVS